MSEAKKFYPTYTANEQSNEVTVQLTQHHNHSSSEKTNLDAV